MPADSAVPEVLTDDAVRAWIEQHVPAGEFAGKRVLMIIPDATRTAPLPLLFEALHRRMSGVAAAMDVLVALGTHPPMSETAICSLLGISVEDRAGRYSRVGLFNHEWDQPERLSVVGTLSRAETLEISNGLLGMDVPVQ